VGQSPLLEFRKRGQDHFLFGAIERNKRVRRDMYSQAKAAKTGSGSLSFGAVCRNRGQSALF